MPFTTEEVTGCINKTANGTNKAPRNLHSYFCISYFIVSVTLPINTTKSSNDFMILIISFISSFEINKVNPVPALTAPCHLFFFHIYLLLLKLNCLLIKLNCF